MINLKALLTFALFISVGTFSFAQKSSKPGASQDDKSKKILDEVGCGGE